MSRLPPPAETPLGYPFDRTWPLEHAAPLASLLECSAPKAGNVHPGASFEDMHFAHFASSCVALQSWLTDQAQPPPSELGAWVLAAVRAVRRSVPCNTILGTLLLFGPLCLAAQDSSWPLAEGTTRVLSRLSAGDSQLVYQAIREAQPGGLGQQPSADIHATAPACLITAMQRVAEMDAVARQYTNGFEDVFQRVAPWLAEELAGHEVPVAICRVQLRMLAHEPDGLITRKEGHTQSEHIRSLASETWDAIQRREARAEQPVELNHTPEYLEFDRYLRADGHRRNPGTTADLIAAGLLVLLLDGRVKPDR